MAYIAAEARQQLLDAVGDATDRIGIALAALAAAYEQLDDRTADRLEDELFRPVQVAYGRARRTHGGFAERHGLPPRTFAPPPSAASARSVKELLERAVDAVAGADAELAALQDSMMPVEVGDAELRAGLAEVRELVGHLRGQARELVRTLGR
ncbi:hypothetical protein FSW04_20825 [Baekduia soli]|uniref:DUF2383 domain-containing protein n=1 Tax=Baekduia soli TaxID=496014 RepID=A0A5B8UAS3_9ACTN|nr:hypothetical protein [Baekduia soli]QEC49772.1 hypothetical protein FSW04_20825 [Baekduia soli]